MAKLSTNGNNLSTEETTTILSGNDNFFQWNIDIDEYLKTSDRVGQHLYSGKDIVLKHQHPGKKPSELDPRVNPLTKEIITGSLKYPREPPPPTSDINYTVSEEDIFSHPLTPASQIRFDKDTVAWTILQEKHQAEVSLLRKDDDICYRHVLKSISLSDQATIELDAQFKTLDKRPDDYFHRTKDYIAIARSKYSTGNVLFVTDHVISVIKTLQSNSIDFATHLQSFNRHWIIAKNSIESKEHPGYASLEKLKFAFLINSIDRSTDPNKTGINNYMVAHKDSMLPESLTKELVDQNISNLFGNNKPDATSEQASALISLQEPASAPKHLEYGAKNPTSKKPHCSNCHALTKSDVKTIRGRTYKGPFYFYHDTSTCNRTTSHNAAAANSNAKAPKAMTVSPLTSAAPPAAPPAPPLDFANAANAYYADLWHKQQQHQQADAFSIMSNATSQQQP